ncbi:MAG TPA: hypothetical protein VFC67_21100 [Prolixibacteraceae bacterium]|nr:hypothetical protein [Prolixibacteraceae bacterium]
MNLLSSIGLSPTNDQLIKFIKRFSTKPNYEKLIERFNQLETNLVKESKNSTKLNEDIIDIKPNFFGLGFNLNALFKLVMRLWNKKID